MSVAAVKIEVRYRPLDTAGAWQFKTVAPGEGSVDLDNLERGVTYQIEARAVALSGAASEWVGQTHVVASTSTLPLAPTIAPGVSLADGVHLSWTITDTQRTDVEYELQRTNDVSGSPNESGWADLVIIRALAYTDGVTDGVTRWYRVRSVTYLGVASAWSSEVSSKGKTVADGATKGATLGPGGNVDGAVDANLRALVDLGQPGHLNKTADNISDGTSFIMSLARQQALAIDNPDFENSTTLNPTPDGWQADGSLTGLAISFDVTAQFAGSRSIRMVNTSGAQRALKSRKNFPVTPGDTYKISVAGKRNSGSAGLQAGLWWLDKNGAFLSNLSVFPATTGAWSQVSATGIVPANAVSAHFELICNNGDDCEYDAIFAVRVIASSDEIADAGIDFTRNYTSKHLGNIPDDAGSSRFAVLAIDANRRALIDIAQAHLGKNTLPATYRAAVLGLLPKVYFRLSALASPFTDESGNGNSGTISGTGTSFAVAGLIAGDNDAAVQFAGASDISVANAASLRNNIVTVIFWIKAAAGSQVNTFGGACCMSGQSTTSPGWTFAQNNTLTTAIVAIATSANNNQVFNFPGNPFDGNLHMIAFGIDGSAGNIYLSIDGASWSTVSFAANKGGGISNSTVPLLLGAQAGGGHEMVGVIDEFALFSSILDETDIAGLYALGTQGMHRSLANVPGQLKGSSNNNPVNSNGFLTGSNPLSQSSNTRTILVAAFTLKFGDGPVSYNAGSVTVSTFGTWFVYFRDARYKGGTVTFIATQTQSDLTSFNDIPTAFAIDLLSGGGGVPSGSGGHIQFQ